jgi:tetraacyldisaccharide 4'-kinase
MLKIEKWIEQKQKEKRKTFVSLLLYFVSFFYKSIIWLRHLAYDFKLLKAHKASLPIVSIGNIVCGGTGKSEFVFKLIKDLKREDVAVLTRGYRSKRRGICRLVKDIDDGDEPFMLHSRLKNIPVIAGKKREDSAILAEKLGAKFAVLDDGMQYLKLKKDLQIVMVRGSNPFGGGFVPFGMRRELLKKLEIADYIVIHGAESMDKYQQVKNLLERYSNGKIFGSSYSYSNNENIVGKKVGVFCGLGNPQSFIDGLEGLKVTILKQMILSDHQKCINFEKFYQECKNLGADFLVCTLKDYVKLSKQEQNLVVPIEISMEIIFDDRQYHLLIQKINTLNMAKS